MGKLKNRREVGTEYTWNKSDIYKSSEELEIELKKIQIDCALFVKTYKGKLLTKDIVLEALKDYEKILKLESWLDHYSFLLEAEDITNRESNELSHRVRDVLSSVHSRLAFFDSQLINLDISILDAVIKINPTFSSYTRHLKKNKAIQLKTVVKEALEQLNSTLYSGERIYQQMKLVDMDFGSFIVDNQEYPLDFSSYEDFYVYHVDAKVRQAAFEKFTKVLRKYQNIAAETYYMHVQMEKTLATMHGFDSVIDYLLYEQEVDRNVYNRQLDTLMENLGPVMQKYILHIKKVHGLEKITFDDLRTKLDPEYTPTVTIEQSKDMISEAVAPLGEEYQELIMKAYPERWIDFVQNKGKETGGFYSCPYGNHPFILLTWRNQLSNVFTLIHELGHAGQGILSANKNSILGCYPSLYLSETASTFNELLLADILVKKANNSRMKQFALSNLISQTYFHNFVTHLLESFYQREVYKLIDEGKSFQADTLNQIKKKVLSDFWGDAVELNEGAELTWMRQNHYYSGLYSYTYSAGLTIATQGFLNIKNNKEKAVENWLNFLALGDQHAPIEAAKIAGVDITTSKPFLDAISFLDHSINEIIELSHIRRN